MLKWHDVNKCLPECGSSVDVVVRIFGLSQSASEYSEYKVVEWRKSINCFIYWERNQTGELVSITYNDPKGLQWPKHPIVTHWAYLNVVKGLD